MTAQAPASNASQNPPSLPNQPFFSWLRTHTTLFITQIIGLLSVVTAPIALVYYSHAIPTNIEWQTIGHLVVYFHILFLVLFIVALVRTLEINDIGSYRARLVHEKLGGNIADREKLEEYSKRQVGRFKGRFLWFWCAMLVLYLSFAFEPIFSVTVHDCLEKLPLGRMFRTELFPILSFVLNNITLICIFRCFTVLYSPRDGTPGNYKTKAKTPKTPDISRNVGTWSRFLGLMRRIVKYLSKSKEQNIEGDELALRQRTLNFLFFLLVLGLTIMYPLIMLTKINRYTNWSEYPAVFDALSGTISAVVLALLVARLDSKLLGLPSWLICLLYFYAGVQPMFVVFELHPEVYAGIKTAVLLVVFIFKIYFFLIIFYSMQTGKLFNYFFCSKILDEHIKELKQPAPLEGAAETATQATAAGKQAESASGTPPAQSAQEVSQSTHDRAAPQRRWAERIKQAGRRATGFFIYGKNTTPEASVPEAGTKDSSEADAEPAVAAEPPGPAARGPEVRRPEWFIKLRGSAMEFLAPAGLDWRAVWFKRFGVTAIVVFAGSLLVYVALPEGGKEWIDDSRLLNLMGLSDLIVISHLILLPIVLAVIFTRPNESNIASPLVDARSKARYDLLLKLSEPWARKASEGKFEELTVRTDDQFKSFTIYFRLFWISLLFLYGAMLLSNVPTLLGWASDKNRDDNQSKQCAASVEQTKLKSEGGGTSHSGEELRFSEFGFALFRAASSALNQNIAARDKWGGVSEIRKLAPSTWSEASQQLFSSHEMPKNVIFSFVFFVINNFSVLFVFCCFTVLYIPFDDRRFKEKRHLLRNYSVLICGLLTVLVPLLAIIATGNRFTQSEVEKIPTVLGALGGTLNAVAFALLIGRLDSRIIGLRALLITVLYAYAALQPLFVTFNQPSNLLKFIATSAMIAAFIFKICLVFMVGHVRRSEGLRDYLWFFPVLNSSVNSIFSNQFEIKTYSPKPGLFTLAVLNKNIEKYRGSETYETRAQCDKAVEKMVRAMKNRENYSQKPREIQGTLWVQVKSDGQLVCESTGLRSQKQADELIEDSIAQIPYCKYDRG